MRQIYDAARERLGWREPGLYDALQRAERAAADSSLSDDDALQVVDSLEHYTGPVSYTHLDVYKRQVLTMPLAVITMMDALKSHVVPTWLQVASSIAGGLNGVITGPLLAITMALIYYDLRIRKEGFDIEALMAAPAQPPIAGEGSAPAAP